LEDAARCAVHRREEQADCWADSVVVDDPVAAGPPVVVLAVVVPVVVVPVVEVADPFEAFAAEAVQFAADPAEALALEAAPSGQAAARVGSCLDGALRGE